MTMLARVRAGAGASALVVVLVGCGNDSASPTTTAIEATTTTASNAALCAARDDLQSSIQDLTPSRWLGRSATETAQSLENGTSGLQTALSKVGDDLLVVKSAASSQLQPQVSAFQKSIDELETAIHTFHTDGIHVILDAAPNAIKAGGALITALSDVKCG